MTCVWTDAYLPLDGASSHSEKSNEKKTYPTYSNNLRTIGFTEIETDGLSIGFAVLPDDEP